MTERRIGTAGWTIPRAVRDRFPPEGSGLARYAQVLNSAEINTTFYRPHRRETFERWAGATPDEFRFAVKAPREWTHMKKLAVDGAEIEPFLASLAGLGGKLGPILVQLPPKLAFEPDVADRFFSALRACRDGALVCEPRHPSWFSEQADTLLRARRVTRVAADPARVPEAALCGGWPDLRYFRLHGSPRIYFSDYSPDFIARLAADIAASHVETWCVFDNTGSGAAARNALELQAALAAHCTAASPVA